ncbi:DUF2935 domain-containing protein [Paenibacillus apiarius]|uniref:DUF2935 domain-containing protein n=1 Tax=Paenibacillus apiarius TaxID=46240 RepID=A0ABT4E575_9BACL|nr:DUF2935 domain-containing protein [Paenibacillus apiarius]MCY9516444.1 DUF2935 domain-containing protein [Paenibacillus apiarius]MCY9523498.1 DUF2935 domain-containing protein [Paenibacillus apiarius]MCY9554282.1 DUF2935 domain-containing protein [Paenibacillus apiarius]MCY9561623.1 DUF2935 domain-containing protein [Paenibacillus apiarius]MCY9687043.1 DUF2935 domain-containing protein [Paenibacillus apiarius]
MQFYYGQQMPLRVLDEAEFWKMQESEHTVVIREALKNLEDQYVEALKLWEQALTGTHQKIVSYVESVIRSQYVPAELHQQVIHLVTYCLDESMKFIELCRQIKTHSSAAKNNPIAQTILDHIIRESEYFIGIARVILYGNA